jgi:hypothetical protein|tara:strand:+ start:10 stop:372 length:363 start_codon:yes stop_codon:yes gene_type:complete
MAITFTYPVATPKASDLVAGTQTPDPLSSETDTPTRNFTIQSIVDLAVAGTYLPLAGGTITGNLTVDGSLNITEGVAMQGTNAAIVLTNPGGYVALTSPNQTTYKITVDDQGNLETTQIS